MIGSTEQNVLMALIETGPKTTAADIYRRMKSGYEDNLPSFGAVYTTLNRMHERKKWVKVIVDLDDRGNERKYYEISAAGRIAVTKSVNTTWRLGAAALVGET